MYYCHSEFTQRFEFMGNDPVAKKFRGHRRQWIIDKCQRLARAFPIEIISLTVRAHRYDMVIHFDPTVVKGWADREVVEHWSAYYVLRRDEAEKRRELTEEDFKEILKDRKQVRRWRERLCHLGEFMQELNGRVASRINRENCGRGAIWASRYEATVLLDEVAVLTAIVNTELAGVVTGPDGKVLVSTYSTLRKRLRPTANGWEALSAALKQEFKHDVLPSITTEALLFVLSNLADWIFRPQILPYKEAHHRINPLLELIIDNVGLWMDEWLKKKDLPRRAIGAPTLLATLAMKLGLKRLNLAWLGNGIYPKTENQEGRRTQRNQAPARQAARQMQAAGNGCDPPP